jgi:hypothetical protein
MSQHSAGPDREEGPILGDTQIWVGVSRAILEPVREPAMATGSAGRGGRVMEPLTLQVFSDYV